MILKDISFPEPEKNILFDEVLLACAEQNESVEFLRFWESPSYFVVLGRIGKEQEDVYIDQALNDDVPLLRRASGGGTVVQGQGCFNYSLILNKRNNPELNDIRKSYQYILEKVICVLDQLGVKAEFLPISDIALKENRKKFSGNAQKRGRNYILHHGTILYDFDLSKVEQYLQIPKDQPDYRENRSHLDFITNIPVNQEQIKESFKQVFSIQEEVAKVLPEEEDCLTNLQEKRKVFVKPNAG